MSSSSSQRFCLRWNNHQSNLLSVFDQLLHDESFVDVTLAVEGQLLKAHKMILSACSPYFQTLFVGHPDKHPIVILKDVPYADMRSLLDFMYRGEVSVDQDRLTAFLKVAESLRIKGLTEVNEERCDIPSIASSLLHSSPTPTNHHHHPPPPHLHRIHHGGSHKRGLPPMAANPLLGSALTAPKRKRGRPRKLSGGGGGVVAAEGHSDHADHQEPVNHAVAPPLNQSAGEGNSPAHSRSDSPLLHHATQPELLEVNMSEHGAASHSPPPPQPPPAATSAASSTPRQGDDEHLPPPPSTQDEEDALDDEDLSAAADHHLSNITIKEEQIDPMPSTSMNDSSGNFKPGSQDGDRFMTPVSISMEKSTTTASSTTETSSVSVNAPNETQKTSAENVNVPDNDELDEDDEERYEDMIACSPANSSDYEDEEMENERMDDKSRGEDEKMMMEGTNFNNNSINQGRIMLSSTTSITPVGVVDMTMKKERDEYLDEDISQYEMDSFRSIMAGVIGSPTNLSSGTSGGTVTVLGNLGTTVTGYSPNKPIDKASVRRYCTHEAENVYRCNVCAKTYTHISNFCRHFLSAHHGVRQEIPCPVCFKLFTRKDNMMTHTKQVHRLAIMRGSGGSYQNQSSESGSPTMVPNDGTSQDSC